MNGEQEHPRADDPAFAPNARTSRQLFRVGALALVVALVWLVNTSNHQNVLLIAAGAAVLVLAALPALEWARRGQAYFPVFEMFMLTCVPFYAVPLLSGHPDVLQFPARALSEASFAMLLFQVCAIGAFMLVRGRPAEAWFLTTSLLPDRALRYAQAGIWLYTVYLYLNGFTQLIPQEFYTVFRAIFSGIGTVSLFIEARRWGAGLLATGEKAAVALNVLVQIAFLFRDLYLITGISVLLLALIGYVSTSRRVPVVLLLVSLPLVAIMHNGKSAMRQHYWGKGIALPTLEQLPTFYQAWLQHGLEPPVEDDTSASTTLAGRLFERASLFQMLCLVTDRTPETAPFLEGESYSSIPAQLVPSFLWPDKPSSLLSNILLALHYRLVSIETAGSVSIAFGMIAEAYANFGLIGCALLGALLGAAYKRASVAALGTPQFSALGLLTILLAAWSFQMEQIFATWLISLLQAAFVVIGGPMLFRILLRNE